MVNVQENNLIAAGKMKPYSVPLNWKWVRVGDVAYIISGEAFKKGDYSQSGIRLLQIANVSFGRIVWDKQNFLPELFLEKYPDLVLLNGDIVMALNRPILNNVLKVAQLSLNDSPSILYQRVGCFRFYEKNINKYFFSYLRSRFFISQVSINLKGSDQPYINTGRLPTLPVPLPPLNEQHRIVNKIEALTARSRKAREALDAIPALLDQFRQSVLAAAFRGDLTADWREQNPNVEPAEKLLERITLSLQCSQKEISCEISRRNSEIPEKWVQTKLKAVVNKIEAGKNFKCPEISVTRDTVGLVKISAVTWGDFDPSETKTVQDPKKINKDLFIKKGDFLVTRANTLELVGASVVVDEIDYKIMLSDKVWRVHTTEINKDYLNFYLRSKAGRKEIESRASGNQQSMRNISQKAFLEIVIAFPPPEEQVEIVRRIKEMYSVIDGIQLTHKGSIPDLDSLNQSILAKAFRGELVPQDPTDEPATLLLQRIQAEREKLNAKSKSKAKAGTKRKKQKP